jgi:sulfite dehydrogenase
MTSGSCHRQKSLRSINARVIVAVFLAKRPGRAVGYGAMGCARWKGARLKDILDKVGLKKETIEVAFDAADGPVVEKTPDFIKGIPISKALEETTLIAYEMNGASLPHFNGHPARLVVPVGPVPIG